MGIKLKLCLGAILALAISGAAFYGIYGKPKLPIPKSIELSWGEVTQQTTQLIAEIEVVNPNPFSIPLKEIDCKLSLDGVELGRGSIGNLNLNPGSNAIGFSLYLMHDSIPDAILKFIQNGERSHLELVCPITAGIWLVSLNYPLEFSQEFRYPILENLRLSRRIYPKTEFLELKPIDLEMISSSWGDISPSQIQIISKLRATNHNPFPINFERCEYECHLDEVLRISGWSLEPIRIPGDGSGEFRMISKIDPSQLKHLWMMHIKRNEHSDFQISCPLSCEVSYKLMGLEISTKLEYQYNHSISISTDLLGMLESRIKRLMAELS